MYTQLLREIATLSKLIDAKQYRLLYRVQQLEQSQVALNQLSDITALITEVTPLGYSTATKAYKPIYALPPESTL